MYSTKVKDLMTRDIVSVSLNDSIEKVAQQMVDHQIGSILVHEDNAIYGIITKRDILEKVILTCQDPCEVKARDVATKNLITISSDETIKDVLILMHKHKVKRILVKHRDDDGLAGIITTYDLIAAFNSLELRSSS